MTITRRSFFRLTAGAAITPVLAQAAAAMPSIPVLWGDGVHDDTEAMQALLDGKVIEFADPAMAKGAGWFGKTLRLPAGRFRMATHPVFGKGSVEWTDVTVDGGGVCVFLRDGPHKACVEIRNANRCTFKNMASFPMQEDGFAETGILITEWQGYAVGSQGARYE